MAEPVTSNEVDPEGQRHDYRSVVPDYGKSWVRVPHLLKLNILLMLSAFLTSTNYGFDGSILNGFQSMKVWEDYFGNPNGAILGALANGYTFGGFLSMPIAPWFTDRYGRKIPIATGAGIIIIGAIIQTCAQDYAMFMVGRIIIGFGSGLCTVASPTLISEVAYPPHRHLMTACYNTLWYLGAIVAAWATYGTYWMTNTNWSWRIPSLLQGLFPLIQILTIYFTPESPRFLIYKDRLEEAQEILIKWHANGDRNSPLVEYELAEISAALQLEKTIHMASYGDFLKTRANKHRLFIVIMLPTMMQLSGNGLVSYFLNKVLDTIGITSQSEQLVINGCLMIYNWVCAIGLACLVEKVGRRPMFLTCFSGMLVTYIIWTALSARFQDTGFSNHGLSQGVLAMIFLYYFCYGIGLNGVPILYFTEILPYHLRAKGMTITGFTTNLVLIYNGFVNPIALEAISWKYYIVYCCIIVVELVIAYFAFPETKGRTLENVSEVFGDDAAHEKQQVQHLEDIIYEGKTD
jgi:sugar porter (SP) family MFS transporter